MKFRIMRDSGGKYVQIKNKFGIWRNWLIRLNCTIVGRYHYEYDISDESIIAEIKAANIKSKYKDELLREFTI